MTKEEYKSRLQKCNTENELLDLWMQKPPMEINYPAEDGHGRIIDAVNHGENLFVRDGIINIGEWRKDGNRKILFLLKEAYGGVDGDKFWSLTDHIAQNAPSHGIHWRLAEWIYGINETSVEKGPAKYCKELQERDVCRRLLQQIAVVNLKKSNGHSSSSLGEVESYAMSDKDELKKQLALINPSIIVCGMTFHILNKLYDEKIVNGAWNMDWQYRTDLVTGRDVIILDFYHPSNRWPAQMNYYALTSIYYHALREYDQSQTMV